MQVTVQHILQQHYDPFAKRRPLSSNMRRAAYWLRHCRTAALGGHVVRCPHGHLERVVYNSCRHRSCPQCSALPRQSWLENWKARLLDCPHYHVVFTTPHELIPLWRYNKSLFAAALFAAASQALLELLGDAKYLGGRVGLLAALHTWSQTLAAHVHLHVLVTAAGLTDDGRWQPAKKSCLLPRKVLMMVFRGKLRAELWQALQQGQLALPPDTNEAAVRSLLNRLGRVVWNVKILDRYDQGAGVATYLAHYLRGGPMGNRRLKSVRAGRVHFSYRVSSSEAVDRGRRETMSLEVDEFLARLLEHVPPSGLHTVRGYGLYAGGQRERLDVARKLLDQPPLAVARSMVSTPGWQEFCAKLGNRQAGHCPACQARLVVGSHLPPSFPVASHAGRSPPSLKLAVQPVAVQ
jgi:hypothetical protein